MSELHVHVFGQMVGTITRNDRIRNRINFTAEPHDLPFNVMSEGISLVPGSKPASSEQTTNFFGVYLPEGQHRTALAARAGVKENDAFGMLAQYGLTMSGAISIRSPEAQPSDDADYRELTSRQLVNKIADAIEKHDLGNEPDSGRSAIQGFQPKLVLARFDGKWHQPLGAAHSTHIIKPALRARPEGIVDEHYSHRLAKRTGLATFDTELIITHGVTFLAIQRYDREVTTAGILAAAHQEDAAQVMGLDWVDSLAKFQDAKSPKSGPSLRKIADIIGSSTSDEDVQRWLSYMVFNAMVGNTDAHAKNVSFIHEQDGSTRLADIYDAVPTTHRNDAFRARDSERRIDGNMALGINGEFGFASLSRRHLEDEARSWGSLSDRVITEVIDRIFSQFSDALDNEPELSAGTPGLRNRLGYNLDRMSSGKPIGKPKQPIPDFIAH